MKVLISLLIPIFISIQLTGQDRAMEVQMLSDVSKVKQKVIDWRRYFHQYPELSNREFKTAERIAEHLTGLGLEIQTGIAHTGVVALLEGGRPGPVIALRADIDALPVKERVDLDYSSKMTSEYNGEEVSVSHACGHDTHIAIMMGVAEVLTGMKKDIRGTIKFIFQPAEEGAPQGEEGGAEMMVKEGVMNNPKVDAIFGLHINSKTEVGQIKYKPGATMAASDWFTIEVNGKQTHGSQPWSGIDPIVVGTQIINGLQTIVSRQSRLTTAPVVITVGKIEGGVRSNIIPERLVMNGTIRTLDSDMQKDVHEKIKVTAENIAKSAGAEAIVTIDTKTLVTFNDHDLTEFAIKSLKKVAGDDNVNLTEWTTGAEDFSFFGEEAPAFYFFHGRHAKRNGSKRRCPSSHT